VLATVAADVVMVEVSVATTGFRNVSYSAFRRTVSEPLSARFADVPESRRRHGDLHHHYVGGHSGEHGARSRETLNVNGYKLDMGH